MKKMRKREPENGKEALTEKKALTGKGSLTVEAVFVMAILLLILMWMMNQAIEMYGQTVTLVRQDWIEVENAAQRFRIISYESLGFP